MRKGAAQRQASVDIVVCIRRAIDLLLARPDIDPSRVGYVGHSYGGNAGAVLTAVDKRIKTFVLVGLTARYTRHIAESPIQYWQNYRNSPSKQELLRHAGTAAFRRSRSVSSRVVARFCPVSVRAFRHGRREAGLLARL